ncbi:MAG: hypothetical protein GX556_13410 [Fibrobacter sp.]|nr:hypothetical protein [Fibrobacter sp.]
MSRIHSFVLSGLLFCFVADAQIISGFCTVKLNGPASAEQTQTARQGARARLKTEIVKWADESLGFTFDTLNNNQNIYLDIFTDACIKLIKEEASFQGKTLMITYNLTDETANQAVQSFNQQYDNKALFSWEAANNAAREKDNINFYISAIKALSYASAHIGSPLLIQGTEDKSLEDIIRDTLRVFLDKVKVTSSNMILEGKAGRPVNNPPSITVTCDSQPLPGIGLTAMQQDGKVLFYSTTDENGQMSFGDFKIPFVANGTLIYVRHNLGKVIDENVFVTEKDLKLRLKNSWDQTFIFKLSRPFYTLEYKASSVSNITLPPDFAGDSHLKKFLQDSCSMQIAANTPADLAIFIQNQVSSYNYSETEEVGIKITAQITVKGLSLDPVRTEQETLEYEKRYDISIDIPYGLFFWEANQKLREAIKNTMNRL